VYGFSVFKQDDPQELLLLINPPPTAYPGIGLDHLFQRIMDHILDPLQADSDAIWTLPSVIKVGSGFSS